MKEFHKWESRTGRVGWGWTQMRTGQKDRWITGALIMMMIRPTNGQKVDTVSCAMYKRDIWMINLLNLQVIKTERNE